MRAPSSRRWCATAKRMPQGRSIASRAWGGTADLKQERHVLLAQRARELLGRGEAVRDQPHLRAVSGARARAWRIRACPRPCSGTFAGRAGTRGRPPRQTRGGSQRRCGSRRAVFQTWCSTGVRRKRGFICDDSKKRRLRVRTHSGGMQRAQQGTSHIHRLAAAECLTLTVPCRRPRKNWRRLCVLPCPGGRQRRRRHSGRVRSRVPRLRAGETPSRRRTRSAPCAAPG